LRSAQTVLITFFFSFNKKQETETKKTRSKKKLIEKV
jgi:hypothetical protein